MDIHNYKKSLLGFMMKLFPIIPAHAVFSPNQLPGVDASLSGSGSEFIDNKKSSVQSESNALSISSKHLLATENNGKQAVQCASDAVLRLLVTEGADRTKGNAKKVINNEILEISSLLKTAIGLNYKDSIETQRIYELLDTHLEPNGKISLLSIKKTLFDLGYTIVGGVKPLYFGGYLDSQLKKQDQAILLLTSQKIYALATNVSEQGIHILYGTGDYCLVPKAEVNQFFKTDVLFLFDIK